MQGIIYDSKTNKIVKVIENPIIKGKNVIGDNGSVSLGDNGKCAIVADGTVTVEKIYDGEIEKERFIPDKYNPNWEVVEPKKSIEDRLADLEETVKVIKEKVNQKEAMK